MIRLQNQCQRVAGLDRSYKHTIGVASFRSVNSAGGRPSNIPSEATQRCQPRRHGLTLGLAQISNCPPYGISDALSTSSSSLRSSTAGLKPAEGCNSARGLGPETAWTVAVPAMNAQAMRDFLPDSLPSAVRNAAMLPHSVMSAYLQRVQQQQQVQQQQSPSTHPDLVQISHHQDQMSQDLETH